jgi:hypothetical protein
MNYHTDGLADLLSKLARNGYPFSYVACSLISLSLATEATDEHSWSSIGCKFCKIGFKKAVCLPADRVCYSKFSHPWCKINYKFVSWTYYTYE